MDKIQTSSHSDCYTPRQNPLDTANSLLLKKCPLYSTLFVLKMIETMDTNTIV
jgi:hypothetical protein